MASAAGTGDNPSPQLKLEDYPNGNGIASVVGGGRLNFNEEQIDCICDSLQQRGDVSKLENFLQIHEADKPITAIGKGSETVMRARAFVAFERGRYRELYNIIETREFSPKYHPQLQDMWYRAHYKEAEGVRGRALGKIIYFTYLVAGHTPLFRRGSSPTHFLNVLSKQSRRFLISRIGKQMKSWKRTFIHFFLLNQKFCSLFLTIIF